MLGNNEDDCVTCDSVIGFGFYVTPGTLPTPSITVGRYRSYPSYPDQAVHGHILGKSMQCKYCTLYCN